MLYFETNLLASQQGKKKKNIFSAHEPLLARMLTVLLSQFIGLNDMIGRKTRKI